MDEYNKWTMHTCFGSWENYEYEMEVSRELTQLIEERFKVLNEDGVPEGYVLLKNILANNFKIRQVYAYHFFNHSYICCAKKDDDEDFSGDKYCIWDLLISFDLVPSCNNRYENGGMLAIDEDWIHALKLVNSDINLNILSLFENFMAIIYKKHSLKIIKELIIKRPQSNFNGTKIEFSREFFGYIGDEKFEEISSLIQKHQPDWIFFDGK